MERASSSQPLSSPLAPSLANASPSAGDGHTPRAALQGQMRATARYLRQMSSRLMMREPSMIVREAAAERLEQQQNGWAYARPVVVLDFTWNLGLVVAALVILWLSRHEKPTAPLSIWVLGYVLQCIIHMICVCEEYRQRRRRRNQGNAGNFAVNQPPEVSTSLLEQDLENGGSGSPQVSEHVSFNKRLESANTMFSFIWWIIGFYWIIVGGKNLMHASSRLYWICVVFLAFDIFFVVFCIALACVVGIAVCCCLPCIIAILYAIGNQEGASDEDIGLLPKYIFQRKKSIDKNGGHKSSINGGVMTLVGSSETTEEHFISLEDAECCICLSSYDDGVELRELPCSHHFHSACVDKWLHIHATCPLCKYNILSTQEDRGV